VANGKHRRKLIFSLDQDEGKIEGQHNLKNYITNFYKELFRPPEESLCALDSSRFGNIPQVTTEENDFLTSPFTEEEVRDVFFAMEHNKVHGPDGFLAKFYEKF